MNVLRFTVTADLVADFMSLDMLVSLKMVKRLCYHIFMRQIFHFQVRHHQQVEDIRMLEDGQGNQTAQIVTTEMPPAQRPPPSQQLEELDMRAQHEVELHMQQDNLQVRYRYSKTTYL